MTAPDVRALLDADAERAGKVEALAGAAPPWSPTPRVNRGGYLALDTFEMPTAEWNDRQADVVRFVSAARTETPWLVERLRARDAAIRAVRARLADFVAHGSIDRSVLDEVNHALASALGGGEQQ